MSAACVGAYGKAERRKRSTKNKMCKSLIAAAKIKCIVSCEGEENNN